MINRLEEEFFHRNQKGIKKIRYKARCLFNRIFAPANLIILVGCFIGVGIYMVIQQGLERMEAERKIKEYTEWTNPMIFQGSYLVTIGKQGFRCSNLSSQGSKISMTLVDGREISFRDPSYLIYPMKYKSYGFWRLYERNLKLTSIEGEFGPKMDWNPAKKE